jgi:hypothetical protein
MKWGSVVASPSNDILRARKNYALGEAVTQ